MQSENANPRSTQHNSRNLAASFHTGSAESGRSLNAASHPSSRGTCTPPVGFTPIIPSRGSILHAETRSFRRARMRNPARQPPRGCRAQRGVAGVEPPRTGALATMARLPPPKLRRHENALCETSGPAPHGPGLRPTGRGVTSLRRRPGQLYRPRHEGRGIGLSWGTGSPAVNRFAQQGRAEAPTQQVARTRA